MHLNHLIQSITGRKHSLFREDLELHRQALHLAIQGRRVLVIGGAGTIGAAFIKKMLHFGHPSLLCVVDISENGLAELTRDLRSTPNLNIPSAYLTYPVDYGSHVFEKILSRFGPFDIVANFAAHKHVRSEKDILSIEAMMENNVLKTKYLLDLLKSMPPRHFFCVSTDKAANPVNVMGASKKLMEDVIRSYSDLFPVTTARFANVLFSNGSLPDGFLKRIALRQPLSTPTDIRRYFVTPEESGDICLCACLLGDSGDIFFPILDATTNMQTFDTIAEKVLHHLGFKSAVCESEEIARQQAIRREHSASNHIYPVYHFKSDTSGEKLDETFYESKDALDLQTFLSLGIIKNNPVKLRAEIDQMIGDLKRIFGNQLVEKRHIIDYLSSVIPTFQHLETHKNLDQKM